MKSANWDEVLDLMFRELQTGGPRAESYWAQQLAFGPVFVHALGLRFRHTPPSAEQKRVLLPCVELAFAAFGSLPDSLGQDPTSLRLLAARQARAIGWRRRATLTSLLVRLGERVPERIDVAPPRMARAYPLIGFRPDERLAG